jgi:Heterokaryon incompatibility protein (HET)
MPRLCTKCWRLTVKSLEVGCILHNSYEQFLKSAKTCILCRMLLAAIHRSNNQFDHEESRYHSTGQRERLQYDSDGIPFDSDGLSLEHNFSSAFRLSLQLSNSNMTCENITLNATLTLDEQTSTTQSKVRVFALLNTMVYLGFIESPSGVQLKSIPPDSRLQGEDKFSLMKDWLKSSNVLCPIRPDQDSTTNHRSKRQRIVLSSPSSKALEGSSSSSRTHHSDNPSTLVPSPRFPSRLIQIKGEGQDDALKLCLLDTSTMFSEANPLLAELNYATLSHRWGNKNHFTTTKANLESRNQGFLISDMPQTYRDAVIVTWKLGLELLWIDALCIIQDDAQDWLVESEKMGDVYQKARVTLAAHAAGDDEQGFLAATLQKRNTIQLKDYSRPIFVSLGPDLNADVTESQLCKRAWVLQERFLSPRIIHFTKGQLYWETIGEARSEEGPILLQEGINTDLKQFGPAATPELTKLLHQDNPTASFGPNVSMETPIEWFRLVEMYTRCGLTKEEDKLIAISGLAKRIHTKLKIGYLAGLWADRIYAGLLWMAEVEPLRKPTFLRAPSWSWASVDGPIQYPVGVARPSFRASCEVLAVSASKKTVDFSIAQTTMWMNGTGALTLRSDMWALRQPRGHVGRIVLRPPLSSNTRRGLIKAGSQSQNDETNIPDMGLKYYTRTREISNGSEAFGWVAFDDEQKDEKRQQETFHDRQRRNLCWVLVGSGGPMNARVHYALFLVPEDPLGTFHRVGVGQLRHGIASSRPTWKNRCITIV